MNEREIHININPSFSSLFMTFQCSGNVCGVGDSCKSFAIRGCSRFVAYLKEVLLTIASILFGHCDSIFDFNFYQFLAKTQFTKNSVTFSESSLKIHICMKLFMVKGEFFILMQNNYLNHVREAIKDSLS